MRTDNIISLNIFYFILCFHLFFLPYFVSAATIDATITTGIFAPGSPVNLAAEVDDGAINLSWSPPFSDGGSAITDYGIDIKLTSGGVWSTYSDGVNVVTTASVISLSNDVSYDFRVYAINTIGDGPPSQIVSATPGSPAQVRILGFADITTPNITSSVQITNEGLDEYEYTYTWCITDSDTNLCGGGNDVFNSTAARLILPGSDYFTDLSSTVNVSGNYWFHLEVQYGSDLSHASQSFSASTEIPTTSSRSGGGRSGRSIKKNLCKGADFNYDGKVSLIDFSILLGFWKASPPFKNRCVDINRDLEVNSIDFSILLSQWGSKPKNLFQ